MLRAHGVPFGSGQASERSLRFVRSRSYAFILSHKRHPQNLGCDKFTKQGPQFVLFGLHSKKHRVGEGIPIGENGKDGKERTYEKMSLSMNILVTAGNTQTPLDRVRCITNIFSGRTGAQIAARSFDRGHSVVLLTSHPEVLDSIPAGRNRFAPDWRVRTYRTFNDLDAAMGEEITGTRLDVVIHAAAVSDYRVAGTFALAPGTTFDPDEMAWAAGSEQPRCIDVANGKVKSSHPELWLRLVPTPKLVDKIRPAWGFTGILVKFKLEVGLSEAELEEVAERARTHSGADLVAANTLDGMYEWAIVGAGDRYRKVSRAELADYLLDQIVPLS
jgi:phosphopantothenoylcysteine synthetase/decarboxylase